MPVATEIPVGIVLRRLHTCVLSVQDRIVRVSKRVDRSRSSSTPLITSFERVTFRSEADITGSRLQRIFFPPVRFSFVPWQFRFKWIHGVVVERVGNDCTRSIDRSDRRQASRVWKRSKKKLFTSTCLYVSS